MIVLKIWEGDSKYKRDTLGKKQPKRAQTVVDSLIPFGMIIGCIMAIILSLLLATALLNMIVLGSIVGLLFGYFVYEIYSKTEEK
ncbi:hypothetical protein SAMN05878443_0847 [Carnobacterium alterfunditum]|uniref:Uncharacterized protein n=1 Tax=Carnobacterium alterfunditum TaxID=28230 RepID=A0A1N6FVI6_9LACT|nr:hypothetical protein SAMN05878443_0847 [Carnobacterium alterfunditum]